MTWTVGSDLPALTIDGVRPDLMVPMAEILADPNQIHLDPEVVKSLGYGDRVINQGPSNCGYVLNMLRAAVPDGRVTAFKARFLANVFGGDIVTAAGRVTAVDNSGTSLRLSVDVWLKNQDGIKVLDGTAEVLTN